MGAVDRIEFLAAIGAEGPHDCQHRRRLTAAIPARVVFDEVGDAFRRCCVLHLE